MTFYIGCEILLICLISLLVCFTIGQGTETFKPLAQSLLIYLAVCLLHGMLTEGNNIHGGFQ